MYAPRPLTQEPARSWHYVAYAQANTHPPGRGAGARAPRLFRVSLWSAARAPLDPARRGGRGGGGGAVSDRVAGLRAGVRALTVPCTRSALGATTGVDGE